MDLKDDGLYTIKESIIITEMPQRTLTRIALKKGARKIDGRYLFTGYELKTIIEQKENKRKQLAKKQEKASQQLAKTKNLATLKGGGEHALITENEALKLEIKELKDELSNYDIEDNERLEVFTNEMYEVFEARLNDWKLQNQKIKSQQELFTAKEKGLNDVVELMTEQSEHYKNQFQYQKEQSTRILDMHEQLIKTIQQNNFIEAKSKGFDKK